MFKKLALVLSSVAMMVAMVPAHALITALDLTPVGTDITTQSDTITSWVVPIIGTILAITIGIKLFKRFTNKV